MKNLIFLLLISLFSCEKEQQGVVNPESNTTVLFYYRNRLNTGTPLVDGDIDIYLNGKMIGELKYGVPSEYNVLKESYPCNLNVPPTNKFVQYHLFVVPNQTKTLTFQASNWKKQWEFEVEISSNHCLKYEVK